MAVNLSKMKAIRDAFHRTPCAPDSERYIQFEESFSFDPTEDQKSCFQVNTFSLLLHCFLFFYFFFLEVVFFEVLFFTFPNFSELYCSPHLITTFLFSLPLI